MAITIIMIKATTIYFSGIIYYLREQGPFQADNVYSIQNWLTWLVQIHLYTQLLDSSYYA